MKKKNKKDTQALEDTTGDVIGKIFGTADQHEEVTQAEDVSKIIKEWLNPRHVDKKTRYTPRQVIAVTILQSLADTYKITTLQRFLRAFKTAKLSEGGKSAEELENILKARTSLGDESALKGLAKFLD